MKIILVLLALAACAYADGAQSPHFEGTPPSSSQDSQVAPVALSPNYYYPHHYPEQYQGTDLLSWISFPVIDLWNLAWNAAAYSVGLFMFILFAPSVAHLLNLNQLYASMPTLVFPEAARNLDAGDYISIVKTIHDAITKEY